MSAIWVRPEELEDNSSSPFAYEACKMASYVLWAFSGRKYNGLRTVTERYECPCRSSSSFGFTIRPYLNGEGQIYNTLYPTEATGGCGCSGTVGGQHVRLRLRGTPVKSVQQVKRNDVVIDPSQYKIVNSSLLQLTDTSLDVCGIEVTYTYGVNVPTAGRRAARSMANELVRGWSGDDCLLPDRVTNVSRQGISFTVIDPQDFLDDGRTGLYEVDLFLRASNPDKARKPARVFSPDLPKGYRVTSGIKDVVLGPYDWQIVPGETSTWTIDLVESGAEILLDADWDPQGQITSWNGATLLEFSGPRFQIVGNTLTVNLTSAETAAIQGSTASWDLYGINSTNGFTLLHLIGSSIYLTGEI